MWIYETSLVALLGADMAETLCMCKGGVEFYVPKQARPEHELAKIVGLKGMQALCASYKGNFITVPSPGVQKTRVLKLLDEGRPKAVIARECGVTERYVYMLANPEQGLETKKPDGQLTLPL